MPDPDPPSRKRHRTAKPPSHNLIKSSKFWFPDGNIDLIAQKTSFRVHSSILSIHSNVFRDMLSIPQPNDTEQLDGCKMVHLSDTSEELTVLLSALYEGASIFGDHNVLPFSSVQTLVRLGMKYQVAAASQEGIRRLRELYSPDDTMRSMKYLIEGKQDPDFAFSIAISPEDSISVLHLAGTFDIRSVMPMAMYACCQLDIDVCVAAVSSEKWSLEDFRSCLKVKEVLRKRESSIRQKLYKSRRGEDDCDLNSCHDAWRRPFSRRNTQHDDKLWTTGTHPLSWHPWLLAKTREREWNCCRSCLSKLEGHLEESDLVTWTVVEEFFKDNKLEDDADV
ncbi:unnamed protein product [Somion occarium]|uniref:BTB domain-containing protein n=1 Tax=Somion occarium TaxID=3059160 RepID=A0ABP1EAS7_9APHY